MTRLSVHLEEHQRCCVVRLEGELDMGSHAVFAHTCAGLLRRDHIKIIVDVGELDFCDCSGVEAMINAQREAERRGGYLRLVGVHGPLARLLTVIELIDTFPPYADVKHASGRNHRFG
ncbi:STAS domain-containing protein [Nonomuraea fuscirosea]